MSVNWVGSSNIWLWVFSAFLLGETIEIECSPVVGPVIMVEAGEVGIWVSVDWVGTSDIWLRIFSNLR